MHFVEPLQLIEIILAITLIYIHFREILKKSPAGTNKPSHFSFLTIILTSLFLVGITFLLINGHNPESFGVINAHLSLIGSGIWCTILVSINSILFGSTLGIIAALILTQRKTFLFSTVIDSLVASFIYILLGIPALVLLYLTYYSTSMNSFFWASVIALSINLSPFVAKIISASIRNISQEQIDSATVFGYSLKQINWYFKFGFVVRTSLQPLLVEYYTTIKLSSFAGIIGLGEIYHVSQDIIKETQDPITSYIILASCYVIIVTPFAVLADFLEQKWKKALG